MVPAAHLLIVDDDPGVREAVATALAPRYQVHTAATALAGLDALAARPFDLVLLDHRLPDIPGTDVLTLIKHFFPSTMIILMTGFGSEDVAITAWRGGARDYIRKPFDPKELQARVDAALETRSHGSERRRSSSGTRRVSSSGSTWPGGGSPGRRNSCRRPAGGSPRSSTTSASRT
ncbi:MAG: response regulator [candidate division NC10 bacterium]|nr:response regulator [candidate division NC10 bacterium]